MKPETFRAALRAAGAVAGVAACTSTTTPPAATKEPDCVAITDQAFGTDDPYPGAKQSVAPEVSSCCNSALAQGGYGSEAFRRHRWACCAIATVSYYPGSLCIPWGPPVPPSMRRGVLA